MESSGGENVWIREPRELLRMTSSLPQGGGRAVLRQWVERSLSRAIRRHDPTREHSPRRADLRRCGSYSVPFASAWRDGEEMRSRDATPPSLLLVGRPLRPQPA